MDSLKRSQRIGSRSHEEALAFAGAKQTYRRKEQSGSMQARQVGLDGGEMRRFPS